MNGAVSKVNKFISHLTRAKRTPSAAATVQVSHALPAVHFSCLLWGRGVSLQDGPAVSTSEWTACSAWETWTVAAADGVRFACVRWEINFLFTFETASFICKHPVYLSSQGVRDEHWGELLVINFIVFFLWRYRTKIFAVNYLLTRYRLHSFWFSLHSPGEMCFIGLCPGVA